MMSKDKIHHCRTSTGEQNNWEVAEYRYGRAKQLGGFRVQYKRSKMIIYIIKITFCNAIRCYKKLTKKKT